MVELTDNPLCTDQITAQVTTPECGAVVLFLGTTRQLTDGRETVTLSYTAYAPMAQSEMEKLEQLARSRWPIGQCVLVHRLGEVPVGQASVAVAVSTPHRRDAFEAASWLMDQIKQLVPVWKKEHWATGSSQWVHPGMIQPRKDGTLQ